MDRGSFDRLFDMTGRTVIVTGGTRGIGLALAEGYVLAGARVVVGTTGPGIDLEQWNRIGFEHGRVVLGDLSRACVRYDHATIGAPSSA